MGRVWEQDYSIPYHSKSKGIHLSGDDPTVVLGWDIARCPYHPGSPLLITILVQWTGKAKISHLCPK